jgi:hypothetical protein
LIAAASATLIGGVAIYSLIQVQALSKGTDEKLIQQDELNRALSFISTDIQEGGKVEFSAIPNEPGYTPIFKILQRDNSTVAYYHRAPIDGDWQAPQIIFRRQFPPPGLTSPSDPEPYALIDAISEQPPQQCPALSEPSVSSTPDIGLKIFIPAPPNLPSKAQICLRGFVSERPDGLEVSILSSQRVMPSMP